MMKSMIAAIAMTLALTACDNGVKHTTISASTPVSASAPKTTPSPNSASSPASETKQSMAASEPTAMAASGLPSTYKPTDVKYSAKFEAIKFKTDSTECKKEVTDFTRNLAQSIYDVEILLANNYQKTGSNITIQFEDEVSKDSTYTLPQYPANKENPFKFVFVEKDFKESKTPIMNVVVNMQHDELKNLQKCTN